MLGLGLQAPWKLIDQPLNTEHSPYEFHLQVGVERGALYSCSECGIACSAHDFKEKTWRHLICSAPLLYHSENTSSSL